MSLRPLTRARTRALTEGSCLCQFLSLPLHNTEETSRLREFQSSAPTPDTPPFSVYPGSVFLLKDLHRQSPWLREPNLSHLAPNIKQLLNYFFFMNEQMPKSSVFLKMQSQCHLVFNYCIRLTGVSDNIHVIEEEDTFSQAAHDSTHLS